MVHTAFTWHRRAAIAAVLLLALVAPALAGAHDAFTVAFIPDTQNYTDQAKPQPASLRTFLAETRYLAEHRAELRLAFVSHVGDVVQHGDGTNGQPGDASYGAGAEWLRAVEAMDVLSSAGVPFALAPGNHDYDNYSWASGSRPLRGTTQWRKAFGSRSPYFAHKRWYGGASDHLAVNPGLSSYQTFQAAGRTFLHIALEMEAGDAALAWAQAVIDAHEGYPTIVTTHAWIDPPADADASAPLVVPAPLLEASYLTGSPGGANGAQGVWDKLVSKNDQIFLVVCGHAWNPTVGGVSKGENLRIGLNDAGHAVYQVLNDLQGNTKASSGGDGWLRLVEFDVEAGAIRFRTYSPVLGKYAGEGGEATFGQDPRFSEFTLPLPVQVKDPVHAPRQR